MKVYVICRQDWAPEAAYATRESARKDRFEYYKAAKPDLTEDDPTLEDEVFELEAQP